VDRFPQIAQFEISPSEWQYTPPPHRPALFPAIVEPSSTSVSRYMVLTPPPSSTAVFPVIRQRTNEGPGSYQAKTPPPCVLVAMLSEIVQPSKRAVVRRHQTPPPQSAAFLVIVQPMKVGEEPRSQHTPVPSWALFSEITQSTSVGLPRQWTPPPVPRRPMSPRAALPEIVHSVNVGVPEQRTPPPSPWAEFPVIVHRVTDARPAHSTPQSSLSEIVESTRRVLPLTFAPKPVLPEIRQSRIVADPVLSIPPIAFSVNRHPIRTGDAPSSQWTAAFPPFLVKVQSMMVGDAFR
jgi:hypothetical protein